jgi:hypothetical protein
MDQAQGATVVLTSASDDKKSSSADLKLANTSPTSQGSSPKSRGQQHKQKVQQAKKDEKPTGLGTASTLLFIFIPASVIVAHQMYKRHGRGKKKKKKKKHQGNKSAKKVSS